MKNYEAIQLALDKVHGQGYRVKEALTKDYFTSKVLQYDEDSGQIELEVNGKTGKERVLLNLRLLLFDLTFARALFGDFWEDRKSVV